MLKDFISERLLATGRSWDYLVSMGYISHITRYRIQRGDYEDPSKKRMHPETKQKLALALQCTQGDIEDVLRKSTAIKNVAAKAEPDEVVQVPSEAKAVEEEDKNVIDVNEEPVADLVNHPPHYKLAGGLEVIDIIEAATKDLVGMDAVCTANAIKYILRWKHKGGVEDVEKAIWYLRKMVVIHNGGERQSK